MKTTMTTKGVDAVKVLAKCRIDVFDTLTPGLNLRVTPDKKTWSFVFTPPGATKRARLGLGTYPATSLHDARLRATEARGLIEAGIDPRRIVTPDAPKLMRELIEERLTMKIRGQKRTAAQIEYGYNKYIIPLVGDVPVADFRIDPHYNRVIDPLLKRGKARQATVVHLLLTALFNFAIQRGTIEFSRIDKLDLPQKYVPRERWLSEDEIKILWASLPTALSQTPAVQNIVKLLLCTGQRLQEVAGIMVRELDLNKAIWTLPAARAKNGREHVVPLSALAIQIIREAMRSSHGGYLFPNKTATTPRIGIDINARVGTARDGGKFGIAYWTPHDLRRTAATHMSKLGVPHLSISHVLNHITNTRGTITQAVYDRHDYLPEKCEALDKWGVYLAKLVDVEVGLRVVA